MRSLPSSLRLSRLLQSLRLPRLLRAVLLLLLVAPALSAGAAPQPQSDSMFGPLPVFEFHSGFWMNLHHMLYQEAKQRLSPSEHPQPGKYAHSVIDLSSTARPVLNPLEQRAWNDAVNFYATNYANHDLLFSNDMVVLKNQLGDFEDCDELSGRKKKAVTPDCRQISRKFSKLPRWFIARTIGARTTAPTGAGSRQSLR